MTTVKLNFTLPSDLAAKLRSHVVERKRSRFVAEAIRQKLSEIEQEELRQLLIEGYSARREEDESINREWEPATLSGWR